MECDRSNTVPPITRKIIVQSSIMRIEPTPELAADLRAASTTLNKAEVYFRYGIWYDTVTILANLRRERIFRHV